MNRTCKPDSGSAMNARSSYRKRCFGEMFVSLPLNLFPCSSHVLDLGDGSLLLPTGSIADSATEASPSRPRAELSEPSNELVRARKRVCREASNNHLPYIKQNTAKQKETSLQAANDLIRWKNSNTASFHFVRSTDNISNNQALFPASTADVTSSRDVTSVAERTERTALRNVAIGKKRANGNAIFIPATPVAATDRCDLQTPDSTTFQSYQELTTNSRQLERSKERRSSTVDSVAFEKSTEGPERGEESSCSRNYWLTTTLPPTDQLFVEPHWTNIGHVVSVYDDFRRNIATLLRGERGLPTTTHSERLSFEKRKPKFEANTTSFPPPPLPPHPSRGSRAAAEVCDAYRRFYRRLCVNSQDFQSLDRRDQLVILDRGQSASVAFVAASLLLPSEGDVYRRHLENDLEVRGRSLDAHCRRMSELSHRLRALDIDLIEESLLNSLLLIAADYPNLSRPDHIEKIRYSLLKTFQAYITAKSDSSSSRLRHLLYLGPKIREMGNELRKLLKQAVSSSRNQRDKKIADSSSSNRFCVTSEENTNDTVPDSTSSDASKTQQYYPSQGFPSSDHPSRFEKQLRSNRTVLLLQHDSKEGNFAQQRSEDVLWSVLDVNDRTTTMRTHSVESEACCSNREILPQNNENDSIRVIKKERQLSFREERTETWKNRAHAITVF